MAAERESRRRGLSIKVRPKGLFERFGMAELGRLRAVARVRASHQVLIAAGLSNALFTAESMSAASLVSESFAPKPMKSK